MCVVKIDGKDTNYMKRFFVAFLILIGLISCVEDKDKVIDVSDISIDFKIERFDQEFYNAQPNDLEKLKSKFPYLFPSEVPDTIWTNKMKNSEEQYLFDEADSVFGNFKDQEKELSNLFKHIKYYYPNFKSPSVVTHISNLDYKYPVIYADSLLLVATDMYLGTNNIVYKSFPKYLTENYKKEHLVVDVANSIIDKIYQKKKSRIFLNNMIEEGKRMYILDTFIPEVDDNLKMNCSQEKLDWALRNEMSVWQYFIEKELLYSTDTNLNARFIDFGPFSKFYLEADQDSPGRMGSWIGWQIVQSFMEIMM